MSNKELIFNVILFFIAGFIYGLCFTKYSDTRYIVKPIKVKESIPVKAPTIEIIKEHETVMKSLITENLLFYAISEVESNHNDMAVGDGGASKGRYQIGKAYWKDACEFGGFDYDYDKNVKNPLICKLIMKTYWKRYGAKTPEEKCRMHNGGPNGHTQDCTLTYWAKIKKVLSKEMKDS